MSRVDHWDENERALYAIGSQVLLDDLERQAAAWRESWALDSTSTDEMTRAHNERVRELEEQQKAWLARFINGDDEPTPTQDVGQGQTGVSPTGWSSPAGPGGPGSGQPIDPHEAELVEAERIRDLPMSEWVVERQRHIRPGQGLI